eukprot:TRINITY_DN92518_c0_g1_i1.p3 TRINITY_DN92518_c0_g1~~TRINITY_DN92518_c0_g1_i1.p3  ORF type:complete len:200 (+),score=21.98 TRINITY_DN92518_c0_g1_i1:243-842(+)
MMVIRNNFRDSFKLLTTQSCRTYARKSEPRGSGPKTEEVADMIKARAKQIRPEEETDEDLPPPTPEPAVRVYAYKDIKFVDSLEQAIFCQMHTTCLKFPHPKWDNDINFKAIWRARRPKFKDRFRFDREFFKWIWQRERMFILRCQQYRAALKKMNKMEATYQRRQEVREGALQKVRPGDSPPDWLRALDEPIWMNEKI